MKHFVKILTVITIAVALSISIVAVPTAIAGNNVWTQLNNGLYNGLSITALAINPIDPNTLYAGTDNGILFKTTDGGKSWTAINTNIGVKSLVISYSSPNTIYAISRYQDVIWHHDVLIKTTDSGANWAIVDIGIAHVVRSLQISPSDPNTMYAGTEDGVFRTTDGGDSWINVNTGLTDNVVSDFAISPSDPDTVYAVTERSMFRTANGGVNWTFITGILNPLSGYTSVTVSPSSSYTLYTGTIFNGSILKSTDGGKSWATWAVVNDGITPVSVWSLAISSSYPDTVYVGTSVDGVFAYTDDTMGDVNNNGRTDLADAIPVLRILAGISVTDTVNLNADVNGDKKIGIEEVIYILQKVTGLRP